MARNSRSSDNRASPGSSGISLLQQVTPLARQMNCLDIQRIATICVRKIPKIVSAAVASLYVLDDSTNMLHLQKHSHPYLINKIVSLNQSPPSPMTLAVRSRQIIKVSDIDKHTAPVIKRSQRPFAANYRTKNCLIAPLLCQDRVVGVLNLADKTPPSGFTDEDIALIELVSQLVGASIGNIKLFEKMQRQARTDGLTGLANHKTFYDVLERELWRCRRYGGQISLIMVDIDNLKAINDTFGHRAGDKVILEVSKRIKNTIRQIDTAARYGGDEFAVVLPNTTVTDAATVAERMVDAVAASQVSWKKDVIPMSISVGLGEYDAESSPDDITSRSDQALYSAKQSGKNTFRIFQPSRK